MTPRGTILVIEADADMRRILAAQVRVAGFATISGTGVPDEPVDLVLLGLPAPPQLAPRQLPDAPLLVLADEATAEERGRWVAACPRTMVLPRPCPANLLRGAVEEAFTGAAALAEVVRRRS